jgi:hypothetical protein
MKKPNAPRVIDIMREHPEFLAARLLEMGVEELAQLHDLLRAVMNSYKLPDEERADLLMQVDQNITKYAHEIMMAYNRIKRDPNITRQLLEGLP